MDFGDMTYTATGALYGASLSDRAAYEIHAVDYGVTADGVTDDGPAIQDAIDAAFGSPPHNDASKFDNRALIFPSGVMLTSVQLEINSVFGGRIQGNGKNQSIIKYTGSSTGTIDDITSVLTFRAVSYCLVRGLQFDANDILDNGTRLMQSAAVASDGTAITWTDCAWHNGTSNGHMLWGDGTHGAGGLGSEQLYINCRWQGNLRGIRFVASNGLDHTFIGGHFKDNGKGIDFVEGGVNQIVGAFFDGNTDCDIFVKQNPLAVVGCRSNGPNFAAIGPGILVGCNHTYGSAGKFIAHDIAVPDFGIVVIDGCHSPNGRMGTYATTAVYIRGCTFGGSYLTGLTGTVEENI